MKKLLFGFVLLSFTVLFSCSSSNDDNQTPSQNTTSLEGVWKLQNIQSGSKLTFEDQNWKLESGTVTISGTFTTSGNTMNAVAVNRSGANNEGLQPNIFSGNFSITNNEVTFTNFSGNWYAVFSTWYQKQ